MRARRVGREGELGEARAALVDESVEVMFVGEPGVGMTRVLDEVLDRAGNDGSTFTAGLPARPGGHP